MRLLVVDPGLRACGVSLWEDERLVACGWPRTSSEVPVAGTAFATAEAVASWLEANAGGRSPRNFQPSHHTGHVAHHWAYAFEWPRIYPNERKKDPMDLPPLVAVAMAVAGLLGLPPTSYFPAEWKGQLPKPKRASDPYVVEGRVRERLDRVELDRYEDGLAGVAASYRHNVTDAVGIGLHHLGRFARRRVFPGAT